MCDVNWLGVSVGVVVDACVVLEERLSGQKTSGRVNKYFRTGNVNKLRRRITIIITVTVAISIMRY